MRAGDEMRTGKWGNDMPERVRKASHTMKDGTHLFSRVASRGLVGLAGIFFVAPVAPAVVLALRRKTGGG